MSKDNRRYQEGVIRSILARPNELVKVVEVLEANDFDDVNFKVIYESMVDLFLKGEEITLAGIALKISETGGAIDPGWFFSLEQNISVWLNVASPVTWAHLLKRESARQKARNTLIQGIEEVNDPKSNPLQIMDKVASELVKVSLETSVEEKFDIKDAVAKFKEESSQIQESGGKIATISSSYPSIDFFTQGWAPTHLITIGARTGIGKSVFAINNAVTAMVQGKSVLFFSLEMTEREVISRMVASIAHIPIHKIEKALPLEPEEEERQNEALQLIAESKLEIDTNPYVTVDYIKRKAIKEAQSENGLDFIIIDYLQLIQNEGKKNRQEAVAEVSRNVKILAKELNVPVMVLVQLNREKKDDGEGDNIPKLYDIRESGAIAQDSNVVILIHRDLEKDVEAIDPKALFIIAKNRQGEANKFITVRTQLECSLFIDDNKKGEEILSDLERSIEENGAIETFNYADNELANMFNQNESSSPLSSDSGVSKNILDELNEADKKIKSIDFESSNSFDIGTPSIEAPIENVTSFETESSDSQISFESTPSFEIDDREKNKSSFEEGPELFEIDGIIQTPTDDEEEPNYQDEAYLEEHSAPSFGDDPEFFFIDEDN